jgi:hypothetical protein
MRLRCLRVHVLCLLIPTMCFAQSTQRRHPGTLDTDVPIPTPTGVLARYDSAAIAELKAHGAAVGAGSWTGMQATGSITFGTDPTSYSATLTNLGSDKYRLDVQTDKGQESIRVDGHGARIQSANGKTSRLASDVALAGIFPFELPRSADPHNPRTAWLDRGLVSMGGLSLHRISFESGTLDTSPGLKNEPTVVVDMYFDPTTHLLQKTASLLHLAPGHPATFLNITTYGDYRSVDGVLVPFRYTETVEGEPSRTLQLSNVALGPSLSSASFDF